MDNLPVESRDEVARRILRRLFLLRNITILGAATGIIIASSFYDLSLPLQPLTVTLLLLAALGLLTWLRLKSPMIISNTEIFLQMLLDIAAITSLFYFTGGATNPFIWFYLLPLIIAATILPRTYTWFMAALTVACYSTLFFYNVPLPHNGMHHDGGFQMHVFGMWLGFVMSAGFVAVIIVGLAHNLRERDRKLAKAREQALQNERLVALGTLATGAAHELGTPLGTMAILTAELEQEYVDNSHSDLHRKLGILREQIERCKEALSVLSASVGAARAESGHRMPVGAYLSQVISEWQAQRPDAILDSHPGQTSENSEIIAERTLTQALINVLNNAADASPEAVRLDGSWTSTALSLEISDRGPGLSADLHEQLGKAPVTTKTEGLGVGLYLAHATLQRLGGELSIKKRHRGGTTVHITLPLIAETGNA
ncbi:MAG: ATP-binding protein [Gammaproteobacteria bacterium]|jgi:two-component system sensor histidine kinase RegB